SLFLTTGMALADTPKDSDSQPPKAASPAKPKAAKKAERADSAIAAEIEELRQAIQSQQEQLQLLKEELAKRDRQIDEAREAAAAANARAAEAGAKVVEAVNSSAEVKTDRAKFTGYYETDFLSAAVTSNNRQSNSYSLRQRQFWGQVALDNGLSFTGGQMWSLVTETKKGVQNRTELPPMTIDPQYN